MTGWSTEKVATLLSEKYNPEWKGKGIEVFMCYVIKHTDKSAESFYWLEVKDLSVAAFEAASHAPCARLVGIDPSPH